MISPAGFFVEFVFRYVALILGEFSASVFHDFPEKLASTFLLCAAHEVWFFLFKNVIETSPHWATVTCDRLNQGVGECLPAARRVAGEREILTHGNFGQLPLRSIGMSRVRDPNISQLTTKLKSSWDLHFLS